MFSNQKYYVKIRLPLLDCGDDMEVPSVGDNVYVPTIDGQPGGLAKVIEVIRVSDNLHHVLIEKCGCYNWENGLAKFQTELKLEFGNQKAVR